MTELTNKCSTYTVKKVTDTLVISGNVTIDSDGKISNLTGQIKNPDDSYMGNFYYSETGNGKSNKTVSDINVDDSASATILIDEMIKEIKENITKEE